MRLLSILILMFFSKISFAEIYKDFVPYMTLKEVKEHYPNGKIEDIKAAWVTKNDGFYKLSGPGISGEIYLAFTNDDVNTIKLITYTDSKLSELSEISEEDEAKKYLLKRLELLKKSLERPLDEKLYLSWVRWAPSDLLPLERVESKYGKAETCDNNSENFRPFCSWPSKALTANLSNDKKYVGNLEFEFTTSEINRALGIEDKTKEEKEPSPIISKKKKNKK